MITSECATIVISFCCVPTNLLIVNSVLVSIPYLTGSTVVHQIAQHVLKISVEDHSDKRSQTTLGPFDCCHI